VEAHREVLSDPRRLVCRVPKRDPTREPSFLLWLLVDMSYERANPVFFPGEAPAPELGHPSLGHSSSALAKPLGWF